MSVSVSLIGFTASDNVNYYPHCLNWKLLDDSIPQHLFETEHPFYPTGDLEKLDWDSIESDFVMVHDSISLAQALTYSPKLCDELSNRLKITVHDCSDVFDYDGKYPRPKQNCVHAHDVLSSYLYSDLIVVSPFAQDKILKACRDLYSNTLAGVIRDRMVVIPPPGYYRIPFTQTKKTFDELYFLWNHRMTPGKNFKEFCRVISDLRLLGVPVRVRVLTEQGQPVEVPSNLKDIIDFAPFTNDTAEYLNHLQQTNCSVSTSFSETFGISSTDIVKQGSLLFGTKSNDTFAKLFGSDLEYALHETVNSIYSLWKQGSGALDKAVETQRFYLQKLPDKFRARDILFHKAQKVFDQHLKLNDFPKVVDLMVDHLNQSPNGCTKQQLIEAVNLRDRIVWPKCYYELRKRKVVTQQTDTDLIFKLEK